MNSGFPPLIGYLKSVYSAHTALLSRVFCKFPLGLPKDGEGRETGLDVTFGMFGSVSSYCLQQELGN